MAVCAGIGRFSARNKSTLDAGPLWPLLLEALAQVLRRAKTWPLADLTGCFVRSDRNAVYEQGPS